MCTILYGSLSSLFSYSNKSRLLRLTHDRTLEGHATAADFCWAQFPLNSDCKPTQLFLMG